MAEKALPEMEQIAGVAKRDFRTVTKTGNELIRTITTTAGAKDHDQIIKEGLEAAIREYISIVVEKSDLNTLVTENESYKFLGKLDIKSIFDPSPTSTTSSTIVNDKLSFQVEKIREDQKAILKKMSSIDQLEKVIPKLDVKFTYYLLSKILVAYTYFLTT